jgi:hypothetical protein
MLAVAGGILIAVAVIAAIVVGFAFVSMGEYPGDPAAKIGWTIVAIAVACAIAVIAWR